MGEILLSLTQSQNLNTNDAARLFAMVSLAGADASIAVTSEKNDWNTWRPITASGEADSDGNPATTPDPTSRRLSRRPGSRSIPPDTLAAAARSSAPCRARHYYFKPTSD